MSEAVEAATVILLRDAADGIETLMLRRNSKLEFAGGMWVFPGGRVDPEDRIGLDPSDELGAARRAAVREALEEANLAIAEEALVPFSHWTPPAIAPKRFLTWFFVASAFEGEVAIDLGEIHDQAWMRPAEAMRRRNALEIELLPPTWVTLDRLGSFPDVASALADARTRSPERFVTRVGKTPEGGVALWHGDAGYESGDATLPGARHRLFMAATWRYERS